MMIQIEFNRKEKRTYAKQIYLDLRKKIMNGTLCGGAALPSSRELSSELSISRNTILTAYEILISEGLVASIPGSGFYVSCNFQPVRTLQHVAEENTGNLSDQRITSDIISFDTGIPALEYFPRSKWNTCCSRALRDAPISVLGYDDPQGRIELREVLADWLKKKRGFQCSPSQILITSGAKQGLTLIAKTLLTPEKEVLMEDPANRNVRQIFSYHTSHLTPIPVDQNGICTDQLPKGKKPALLFTTPSHQFPMGGILPFDRRLALANYGNQTGCILIEDDYDSEFRYDSTPVSSIYELAPDQTIYVGTFSKILYPSLRLGYLVLPQHVVSQFREWKRLNDHHSNSVSQLALTRFIEHGDLDRHLRQMKKIYRTRRDLAIELIHCIFPERGRIYGGQSGMHLVLELPGADFSEQFMRRLLQSGVFAVSVEEHSLHKGNHCNQIILGYSHLSGHELEQGFRLLHALLSQSGC